MITPFDVAHRITESASESKFGIRFLFRPDFSVGAEHVCFRDGTDGHEKKITSNDFKLQISKIVSEQKSF